MGSRRPQYVEPRVVTRYPGSPNLAPIDTSLVPRSRQHLTPSTASPRSRSGSPFSTHSASSHTSNRSNNSFTSEQGRHTKSRYLKFSHNGKTELLKFDTIQKKLDWIEKNRHKYPSLQVPEVHHHYHHHHYEPSIASSTSETFQGIGAAIDPYSSTNRPSSSAGTVHIDNYFHEPHFTDARGPRISIDGIDAPQLRQIHFGNRDDGPAAMPVMPPTRPRLPNNSGGAAAIPPRQLESAGQRR